MSTSVMPMSPAPPPKHDKPRPRRAHTGVPTSSSSTNTPSTTTTTGSVPSVPPKPRRSHSTDPQGQHQMTSSSAREREKKKKASMHADVIDMMDYSGNARFHHDGPFDAVAPSRNRHPARGPMGVFDLDSLSPSSGGGPYPSSAAIAAVAAPPRPLHTRARSSTTGPVSPSVAINPAFIAPPPAPDKKKNAVAEAWGIADPEPFEEFSAGGTAAYASSGHANLPLSSTSAPSGSSLSRSAYHDYWNEGDAAKNASRNARRTRTIPPPQQIMLPGSNFDATAYRDPARVSPASSEEKVSSPISPSAYPGASPPRFKRTKSLMQRIRTMRDNPNVPVGAPDPDAPDPVSPYDGHMHYASPSMDEPRPILYASEREGGMQNSHSNSSFERERESRSNGKKSGMSLFNRLARSPRQRGMSTSPPVSPLDESAFVFVQTPKEAHASSHGTKQKALPSLPPDARSPPVSGSARYEKDSYFDGQWQSTNGIAPGLTPGGQGLGRKRSLLSKMKGVSRK